MDEGVASALVAASTCFGRADPVESAVVTGWFVAPDEERAAGRITAFIDGEPAGQALLVALSALPVGAPQAARGFSYPIPWHCQDGRSHALSLAFADGTSVEFLTRSGVTRSNLRFRFEERSHAGGGSDVHSLSQPLGVPIVEVGKSDYVGLADSVSATAVSGWAVCRGGPAECVNLRIFVDGQAVGSTSCDLPHDPLRALGLHEGAGGFVFEVPERFHDGLTHSLCIVFDDGSPMPFRDADGGLQTKHPFIFEPATSIDGIVDGLDGHVIKGWAVRRHHETGNVEGRLKTQVLCNGIIVGEITADRPRSDVANEHGCEPFVGFEFTLPQQCRNGLKFEFVFKVLPEGKELAGCPLLVRHRSTESADELRALADTIGALCAQAFKVQRQVRDMLPVAESSVLNYDNWARRYLARLHARVAVPLPDAAPLISVVMPVYRTNLAHLAAAIESVREQTYSNWELIIIDDGSRDHALRACLRNYAAADERVRCLYSQQNRGISAATNSAIRKARGAYVVLFDHDDLMVGVALETMAREALNTGAKVVYSDEDKIDAFGAFGEPNLKPDWNYRLLLGNNYVCHLLMVDTALLRRIGLLRSEYDGAQDHDLVLRLSEKCSPEQIVHLPEILYHWRKSATSTAASSAAKPYAIEAGRRAVADHLVRRGFHEARVTPIDKSTSYKVAWGLVDQPSVTVIVPFKDQIATTRRCVESLLASTDWPDWRVVLVDNGSVTPDAAAFCREIARDPHVVIMRVDEPFNYSRLNNLAARRHPADYYVFLNNDVFLEQSDWLRVLIDEALADPKVAIVGAKLLYPNGTVQHAGVVLGVGGIADHVFRGLPGDHPGYSYRAKCAQQYSAVTAACMLCRGDVFLEVGGFDERELLVAYNDVDLCLKIGSRGWHVVWTPELVAEHHESMSRGDDISGGKAQRFFFENHVMLARWRDAIDNDPHYNPHFSRERGIFMELG